MSTPHNAAEKGQIAETVLMPGDPLRAKFIAENFLDSAKLVSSIRNIYCYTGKYKGYSVSVMASGMGMPSIGIYSYELYKFYDVENIIRIGSAGAYTTDLKLYDILLANSVYSASNYANNQSGETRHILLPSDELNEKIIYAAENIRVPLKLGRLNSSDNFYTEEGRPTVEYYRDTLHCAAVEMESFALLHNANVCGKNAACLVTISDSMVSGEQTSAEERQNSFTEMMKVALDAAVL